MPYEVFKRGVHVCFNLPIGYPDPISELRASEFSLPPTEGNHRDVWAKFGEYSFIPYERWLHNAEHGPAIFLYDGCLRQQDRCKIRNYISRQPSDGGGPFRWIMSSWLMGQRAPHLLDTPLLHFRFFVATYSSVLAVHCFDESTIDWFLERHYREAYEDMPMDGNYDYQFIAESACGRTRLERDVIASSSAYLSATFLLTALVISPNLKRSASGRMLVL